MLVQVVGGEMTAFELWSEMLSTHPHRLPTLPEEAHCDVLECGSA